MAGKGCDLCGNECVTVYEETGGGFNVLGKCIQSSKLVVVLWCTHSFQVTSPIILVPGPHLLTVSIHYTSIMGIMRPS